MTAVCVKPEALGSTHNLPTLRILFSDRAIEIGVGAAKWYSSNDLRRASSSTLCLVEACGSDSDTAWVPEACGCCSHAFIIIAAVSPDRVHAKLSSSYCVYCLTCHASLGVHCLQVHPNSCRPPAQLIIYVASVSGAARGSAGGWLCWLCFGHIGLGRLWLVCWLARRLVCLPGSLAGLLAPCWLCWLSFGRVGLRRLWCACWLVGLLAVLRAPF